MKKTKELLAAIMTAAMVVTSFSNTGLTVWASQAEEATKEVVEEVINTTEYDYLTLNEMMEEEAENHSKEIIDLEEIFEEIPTVEAQPEEVGDSFPTSLDWSESKYFPAIGNQESTGSCGYFSIFYTNFTFAHNRTRGVETTESNTVNPVFGYNFYGIMSKNSYYLTREIGFATLGVLPLDLYSRKTLSPTKEVWESALNHRAVDIETVSNYGDGDAIITGPTDPTLNQIKQTLNDGYLIGIGTLSSSWNFSVVASGKHKGEVAIDRCDAGTIKANKVKNSSRKSYFMYNDFNRPKIREKDNSGCICYMTVNTGSRKEMTMTVTATSKADGTKESYQFIKMDLEKENLSWDGTTNATDGTMVFDLENAVSDISGSTMEDYEWEVIFEDDTADAYALTVKDLYFTVDGTKTYTTNISKIPLNGTEKVYKMVPISEGGIAAEKENTVTVYYNNSKFDSAYIHYRAGDGTWTTAPGVQMCSDSEQSGYTWKYVIDLGDETEADICFNDGNGVWDNNNSQDYTIAAGVYGVKDGKITALKEVTPTPEPTATATPEPTITAELTVTSQPTITPEPTVTEQPTVTPEPTVTNQPTVTAEPTVANQPTVTPEPTVTNQPTVTAEPTVTNQPTVTLEPTVTEQPTVTAKPTATITTKPMLTATPTPTAKPTTTITPTVTVTPIPTAAVIITATPTPTAAVIVTATAAPTAVVIITATPAPTAEAIVTATAAPTVTMEPTKTPQPTTSLVSDKTTVSSRLKSVKLVSTSTKDKYKVYTNKKLKLKFKTNGSNLKYQIVKKDKKLGSSWKSTKGTVTLKTSGVVYIKYTLKGKQITKKTVGVVIDTKKPKIKVSRNKLKVTDKGSGIKYIKVNGKKVKNNSKLKAGKNKIVVMDKAGNKTTKTVRIR